MSLLLYKKVVNEGVGLLRKAEEKRELAKAKAHRLKEVREVMEAKHKKVE